MKYGLGVLRCIRRFRAVTLVIAIALAMLLLAWNSTQVAQAKLESKPGDMALTATYWGADTNDDIYWCYQLNGNYKPLKNNKCTVKPAQAIPLSFYAGKIGCGTGFACGNIDPTTKTVSGVFPAAQYAYWYLTGPGYSDTCEFPRPYQHESPDPGIQSECDTIPFGLLGSDLQLYRYGCHQANAFVTTYAAYSATFQGNTLFGDIENPIDAAQQACGWGALTVGNNGWEEQVRKNNLVWSGYLAQMKVRSQTLGKRVGMYAAPGTFPSIMGTNYVLPPEVVLWVSRWLWSPSYYPNLLSEVTPQADLQLQTLYFGQYPTVWQFHGDPDFNVTGQNPLQGFVPRPENGLARGFYPQGIHVDYYNDVPPPQYTLESPINWNTFTTYVTSATVSTINFNWGTSSPAPGVRGTFWSAIFSGTLSVPYAGPYTFYLEQLDDGGRLFINNTAVIDSWRVQGPHNYSATVSLPAGQLPIRIEYAQGPGFQGSLYAYWSSEYFVKELISPVP